MPVLKSLLVGLVFMTIFGCLGALSGEAVEAFTGTGVVIVPIALVVGIVKAVKEPPRA